MGEYKVCGYDMEILHARMLEIAVEVDRICRVHGWKCSLYGGSIIGAVRHDGFIPWDHDIDMAMPRKDYDKLVKYFLKNNHETLFFSNYKSEPLYPNNWGKMRLKGTAFVEKELETLPIHQGVFIDIHPIDNVFSLTLKLQVRLSMFWSCVGKVKSNIYTGSKKKKRIYRLFSWMPRKWINCFRDYSMKIFKYFPTKFVYKVAHPNNGVYVLPRNTFEDLIEHKFENYKFFIPKDYDSFLRKRYGDYMKIPPEAHIKECCTSITKCIL